MTASSATSAVASSVVSATSSSATTSSVASAVTSSATTKVMAGIWKIGNHVKVYGMANDFILLSYAFILGGCVELILESTEGGRYFLKRRKFETSGIEDECAFGDS